MPAATPRAAMPSIMSSPEQLASSPCSPFSRPARGAAFMMGRDAPATPPAAPERVRPPRGYKTGARARLLSKMEERVQSRLMNGVPRAIGRWDPTKRDPELWIRHGTCLVYLHAQGEDSRRGPSFRLPLASLLAADCHPVLDLFAAHGVQTPLDWDIWLAANPDYRVQLFIPAPPGAGAAETYRHHMATRNFFAWAMRGNGLVFDNLGGALVDLLGCMVSWRAHGIDHVADLVEFLEERGYWDFSGHPAHALAALRLAETYRIKDVYVDAFAHCVGMGGALMQCVEYRNLSLTTRRLLRAAKTDADAYLGRTSTQMSTFLADDLSETHLGLSSGARAHLERFQDFLVAFYADRFGSFPPRNVTESVTAIWAPDVYRTLRDDFEALYNFLVDETFTSAENTPLLAQGGICAVQSVHSFDVRHQFTSLRHPLPLLPEIAPGMLPTGSLWPMLSSSTPSAQASAATASPPPPSPSSPRRRFSRSLSMSLSSFGIGASANGSPARPDKLRPDERLVIHAALIKATNHHHIHLLDNPLVLAYRRFEEEGTCGSACTAAPRFGRVDRDRDRVSLVDARKVRWILVYAMYQMIRSVTDVAAEVHDADEASYLLFSSMTAGLPLWDDEEPEDLLQPDFGMEQQPPSPLPRGSPVFEIKPDIDYMEMYQQQEQQQQQQQQKTPHRGRGTLRIDTQLADAQGPSHPLSSPKSPGLAVSLSRKGTLRRSLSMFSLSHARRIRPMASAEELPAVPALSVVKRRTSKHHEIVVQGYGNGMTSAIVNAEAEDDPYRATAPSQVLAPAASVLPMAAAILRESAQAPSPTQRSMSTSSNRSKNSSVASYSTAPTTAPVTPTSEVGIHHHHHHHPHPFHSILADRARTKHQSAPCAQPGYDDLPGLAIGESPSNGSSHARSAAPRRASSLVTTQSATQPSSLLQPSSSQSRGRSARSSTHSATDLPSRITPSSRAPSVDTRLSWRSSAVALRPVSAHEASLRASTSSASSRRKCYPHHSYPHHHQGEECSGGGGGGMVTRSKTWSWRESAAEPEPGAWTIVSPSLGDGNTCPLELDVRGSGGFSARVGLA